MGSGAGSVPMEEKEIRNVSSAENGLGLIRMGSG